MSIFRNTLKNTVVKNVTLTVVFLSFASILFAQKPLSITSVRQLTDSIKKVINQEHITGMMVGIIAQDTVNFSGGFGYADIETKREVDENTLFRMGSITKMFVALGIMKLVNEGKLRLKDELKKVAPEVPFINKWENEAPVEIINLLEHTAGFDDIKLNHLYAADGKEKTGIDMVLIQKNSLVCRWRPGERFAYCNPDYAVLGYLIEKISAKPYGQYLTENILAPLGMVHSNFNPTSNYPLKDVKEYVIKNGQTIPVKTVTLLSGPQGSLWSNATDMLKFLQFFLKNGSPLFDAGSIHEIETCHSTLAARCGQKNGYSLANDNTFFTDLKYPFRGHDGLTGTCYSSFKYNRELGAGFILSSNCNNNNYHIEELIASYLAQNAPEKKLAIQPTDKKSMEPFLGRYQFESPRNEIASFSDKLQNAPLIYIEGDRLYLKPLFGDPLELVQTAPMIFAWKDENMHLICFTKNSNGTNVMMIAGSYFEQTSGFWAITKRGVIIVALGFILSSFILAIASIIKTARGKLPAIHLMVRLMPATGAVLLAWAISKLLEVQQYTYKLYELDTINATTLIIFFGTAVFGIFSIGSLSFSIYHFKKSPKNWFVYYMLFTGISFCLIAVLLFQNGWIGLRTWTL